MTGRGGLEVQIDVGAHGAVPPGMLERAVGASVAAEGKGRGEVSVTLLDDASIRKLNREYLDRDEVTDVIAFSLGSGEMIVGDIYVGYQQAERQAGEWGASTAEEIVRLTVHGTLHVLGYDHPEGPERMESPMFRTQEAVVRKIMTEGPDG